MSKSNQVLSDEEVVAMRKRNEEKAAAAVAKMGTSYVGHPVNLVKKNPKRANFVPAKSAPVSLKQDRVSFIQDRRAAK